jgi:N6-adenosine-specific RNA methylase IME4
VHTDALELIPPGRLTRQELAQRIGERWRAGCHEMLATIFAVGRALLVAKEGDGPQRIGKLPHGEFMRMIGDSRHRSELPFGYAVAYMLMAVARDERLRKFEPVQTLPPVYKTLYQMTRLDDAALDELVRDGTINPHCSFSEINRELRLRRVARDMERVAKLTTIDGRFGTIVVDPPWCYDWLSAGAAARPGYAMMPHEELLALDVGRWAARHCHLYVWTPNNFLPPACELVTAWGFQHRSVLTWVKTDRKGKARIGLGQYFRNTTEHCLFATRGELPTRTKQNPTHFAAPVGKHSAKPERFYEIVRAASYPPYGEAFQRQARTGFANLFATCLEAPEEAAQ